MTCERVNKGMQMPTSIANIYTSFFFLFAPHLKKGGENENRKKFNAWRSSSYSSRCNLILSQFERQLECLWVLLFACLLQYP